MGKKLLVSLALEGKFSGEGLQSIEVDDDVLTAMARELVTRAHVGESADDVWRQVQAQHREMCPPVLPSANGREAEVDIPVSSEQILVPHRSTSNLVFGIRPSEAVLRRPSRAEEAVVEDQLSLF